MARRQWDKLVYAGIALPTPDEDGISLELNPRDESEYSAAGNLNIEEINLKRRLSCTWSSLDGNQTKLILNALHNNRVGTLKYYDAALGEMVEMNAYYESGARANYFKYSDTLKRQRYSSVSVEFAEI